LLHKPIETEEKSKVSPEPLTDAEREKLSGISDKIKKAAEENDVETVNRLRRQLIGAANLGILGPEDALDAVPPNVQEEKR
jgi:hypothetical protein